MSNSVVHRLTRLKNDPAIRTALVVFVIVRLGLSVWMWGVRQVYSAPLLPDQRFRPYLGVAVETNPWLEPWQRWDTLHYQAIADRGYTAFERALFVPPLYPLLMRWGGELLGGQTLLAGIVVANLAYFACLVALYRLVFQETGDEIAARRTLIYLASFPTAFFFLAAYTESLYLLAAVLALHAARQEKWWQAGIWGGVAALARLPGALIVVPLIYAAWQRWRRSHDWRAWAGMGLAPVGAAVFPLYVWLGLDLVPWTPISVQSARFDGGLTLPGVNLIEVARHILAGHLYATDALDLIFTVGFLACAWPVWRRLPRIHGVYYLAWLALYLTRIGGTRPLLGMTRYVLVFFPAFILLGIWGSRPWVNRVVLYSSWAGLLFMSGVFAMWGWAG